MIALWFVSVALGNAVPIGMESCDERTACAEGEEARACPVDALSGRAACEKLEKDGFATRCKTDTSEVMCRALPAAADLPDTEERRCATTSGTALAGLVALLLVRNRAGTEVPTTAPDARPT